MRTTNGRWTRRDLLRHATAAGATMALAGVAGAATVKRRPNFLVIVADDMGYSDPGCYGGEVDTPNLDNLAAGGVRFTQVYSTGRCWPSRTCILTGHYAQQVRMDPPKGKLPAWTRLAPHYLKPLGYRCYHSGKWHIRGAPKPIRDAAFDRSYVLHDHDRFFTPKRHEEDDQALPAVAADADFYTTTEIANRAIGYLKQHAAEHADTPFFQYLAFNCPHFPLHALPKDILKYKGRYARGWDAMRRQRWFRMRQMKLINCALPPLEADVKPSWNLPPEKLKSQIGPGEAGNAVAWDSLTREQKAFQSLKMAIHAAMVDRMDTEIGRVLNQIKEMGEYENTVVMFVSDNGASAEQIIRGDKHDKSAAPGSGASYLCLGPGFSTASNTPFRLHKSWVHEGGIASPLIVHWPAGLKAKGELRHNPGHFVDLLPTILELAGTSAAPTWKGKPTPPLAGRSLAPALVKDHTVPHEFLYFNHSGNRAIRVGDWKLVARGKGGPWELYNLKTDRCEMKNLAKQDPARARKLSETWQKHEDEFRRMAKLEEWNE